MVDRIFSNRPRGTMTSAIWKVMDRLWRTIFAPIFTSRSRSVVIDQNILKFVENSVDATSTTTTLLLIWEMGV